MQKLLPLTLLLAACTPSFDPLEDVGVDSSTSDDSPMEEEASSTGMEVDSTGSFDSSSSSEAETTDCGGSSSSSTGEISEEGCFITQYTPVFIPSLEGFVCSAVEGGVLPLDNTTLTGIPALTGHVENTEALVCDGDETGILDQLQAHVVTYCTDTLSVLGCSALASRKGPGAYDVCEAVGQAWIEGDTTFIQNDLDLKIDFVEDFCRPALEVEC